MPAFNLQVHEEDWERISEMANAMNVNPSFIIQQAIDSHLRNQPTDDEPGEQTLPLNKHSLGLLLRRQNDISARTIDMRAEIDGLKKAQDALKKAETNDYISAVQNHTYLSNSTNDRFADIEGRHGKALASLRAEFNSRLVGLAADLEQKIGQVMNSFLAHEDAIQDIANRLSSVEEDTGTLVKRESGKKSSRKEQMRELEKKVAILELERAGAPALAALLKR